MARIDGAIKTPTLPIVGSLAVGCPRCGVTLERGATAIVYCVSCGTRYGTMEHPLATTQEWMPRAGHPLRKVIESNPGYECDGRGMTFKLECGHTLKLHRKGARYDVKRLRCPFCPREDASA